jgi:ectoine hydroxylase-related dioxygenase (phytanoyl-CoA dioxygenase family)
MAQNMMENRSMALTTGGIGLHETGELRDSTTLLPRPEKLRKRFSEDGYLLIRGFFDRAQVEAARRSVAARLAEEGVFAEGTDPQDLIAKPGLELAFRPDLANDNPEVTELLYADKVMALYEGLFEEPAMHYDYTWLRAMAPGRHTLPHYDNIYMGRGTQRVMTAWAPLVPIDAEIGGLIILENSHRWREMIDTYGQVDVDAVCENKAGVAQWQDRGLAGFGGLPDDPNELAERLGSRWLTAEFQPGDLLTFGMFTLHGSSDNHSRKIRLSTDSRYQPANEPADERWVGEKPIGHGPNAQRNAIC